MKTQTRKRKPTGRSLDERWKRGPLAHLPRPKVARRVAAIGFENVDILDITGPLSTFAAVNHIIERDYEDVPTPYRCEVLGKAPGPVATSTGVALMAERVYGRVRDGIDTLIIPGGSRKTVARARSDKQLIATIRRLAPKVRRLASVCTGTFLLAEAGLLDGRKVVTHWGACGRLADEFPALTVDPDPIFIRDRSIYSAAGKTAGIDLALALIEEDLGREWALAVSRYMVVHLKRPGGQSQFSIPLRTQIQDAAVLDGLPGWITENLAKELTVEVLAGKVGMSPRNFARVFRKAMRMTPAKFVESARLEAARLRIEESALPLETLARDLGFGSSERLRRAFQRHFGVNPDYYRDRFGRERAVEKGGTKRFQTEDIPAAFGDRL